MKSLPELIHDYKSGVPGTDAKILQRMQPLIKGTAAKIHCMEREDSQQELYLSLLQAIPYLNEDSSEGECVKYIQTVIQNRYKSLCRCNLSAPETDDIDSSPAILTAPDTFDDSYYDIAAFIASLPEKSIKQEIMTLFFVN